MLYRLLILATLSVAASSLVQAQYASVARFELSTPDLDNAGTMPSVLDDFASTNVWDGAKSYSPSATQVRAFLAYFVDSDNGDPDQLCDYRFGSFQGTAAKQLILSYSYNPGGFCKGFAVAWRENGRFQIDNLDGGFALTSLDGVIKDLDHDGIPELIVTLQDSDYEGVAGLATWEKIFQWNGDMYVDASAAFPEYYKKKVLPALDANIAQFEAKHPGTDYRNIYFERNKILRFLGIDPHAGFARAEKWMKSADPADRGMAIRVFEEIHDRASIAHLRELEKDKDPVVRMQARRPLSRLQPSKSKK